MKKTTIYLITLILLINPVISIVTFHYEEEDTDLYIKVVNDTLEKLNITEDFIRIDVFDNQNYYPGLCGLYWPFTNRIYVFNRLTCNFHVVVEHELWHYVYWKMPVKEQLNYCFELGYFYSFNCWEYYVIDNMYGEVDDETGNSMY